MKTNYIVTHDAILKEYLLEIRLSRHFCKKVKLYGKMYVNDIEVKNYVSVKTKDIITLELDEELNQNVVLMDSIKLDIKYEDEYLLIINKPSDLATLPTKKHFTDNVISLVKNYYLNKNINSNIHIVNRLDYSTSGLMVIAKDGLTHFKLSPIDKKVITRKYVALVDGIIPEKKGEIGLPIARIEGSIKREVNSDGKYAKTLYKVIKEVNGKTLVDVELVTGRTHQIRVHFSHLGFPLVGDKLYNDNYNNEDRLCLHCYYVSFVHPYTNNIIEIIDENKDNYFSSYY